MEGWQGRRMKRAQEQDISVTHVDMTHHSFIYHVQGVSGEYMIEIYEDVTLWPPTCDCQDYYWRGDILCKHIILCLVLMGVDAGLLEDSDWEPQQEELYELLCNAPSCVGCTIATNHGVNKGTSYN